VNPRAINVRVVRDETLGNTLSFCPTRPCEQKSRYAIGGDKSLGVPLGMQAKLVATNDNTGICSFVWAICAKSLAVAGQDAKYSHVTVVIVKNSGHWILEEQPKQTTDALLLFLQ
jgi:pimeloyl-ACP methyl ester carboxylesterase